MFCPNLVWLERELLGLEGFFLVEVRCEELALILEVYGVHKEKDFPKGRKRRKSPRAPF